MATLLRVTLSELAAMAAALLRQSSIRITAVNKTVIHIELVPKRDISSLPEVDLPFDALDGELKAATLWVVKADATSGALTVGIEDAAPAAALPARPQAQQPTAPAPAAQPTQQPTRPTGGSVRSVAPAPAVVPLTPTAPVVQPQAPTPPSLPTPVIPAVVAPTPPALAAAVPASPVAQPPRGNWFQRALAGFIS